MDKGVIYYTDNEFADPLFSLVQKHILNAGLPITSTSLKPIKFGDNISLNRKRGYVSYILQILSCLERSKAKYVFFTEHDVLYHRSHFDFTPPTDDLYYYNANVWKWQLRSRKVIRHDRMLSLSNLCVNRELALSHYRLIESKIKELGEDAFNSKEPAIARNWGYEPGTKSTKRGGLTDEQFATWESEYPNIDIRHDKSFSQPKVTLESFRHQPKWWKEIKFSEIIGWNLYELWQLSK